MHSAKGVKNISFIYKITNKVNGKMYVGKTMFDIQKRFKEHCADSIKKRCEKRPLYSAMRKYGINNFYIEELEECDDSIASEREIYWIATLDTYRFGYNATYGGEGTQYVSVTRIKELWNAGNNVKEICGITGYCNATVRHHLHKNNINSYEITKRGRKNLFIPVAQIDINSDEIIKTFESVSDAANSLDLEFCSHISSCCKGKSKTAYGYKWKYLN